ncbi:MAG: acetyl-CoA acetyltransferase, partial [Deltaproteobacteria bacterium]|nr:acetyl-CoA acetyltransferase [Deltaproteobacteria bacterium]
MDPRTPVLIGCAAVGQREEDPARAREPLDLMEQALRDAAEDAEADVGAKALLERIQWIAVPQGFWNYSNPAGVLGGRVGATGTHAVLTDIGVLQTTLLGLAGQVIADGRAELCVVVGGEAKYRTLRAKITGSKAPLCEAPGDPDEVLRPKADILHPLELRCGLGLPVKQYAMIENALRIETRSRLDSHRSEIAELWAAMSRVAATNPDAWNREAVSPSTVRDASDENRMLAFPYTKLHNSQWNVDQAAALILCSAETADALGVPRDRRIVLRCVADSNFMLPLCERKDVHRSAGFAAAGRAAFEAAGIESEEVGHRELYSCFPSAVRVQQRELGVPRELAVTVTGGMTFAGGPLNNFVLQAAVKMAQVLRDDPGSIGMLNAVSGMLTKQGVSLWSTEAGNPFAFL